MHPSRYLPRKLPEKLKGLAELAVDMRWSWDRNAEELWRRIDSEMWDATGNPWFILESVSQDKLDELAKDESFLELIKRQLNRMKQAQEQPAWFQKNHSASDVSGIAYFSMEFGLSEALPIYSGGLGILAGDHLKTANDLGVPLYGIGLLYQQGYFRQAVDAYGNQLEFYPYNDPVMLPVMPLLNGQGDWLLINVELPGRTLILKTWQVRIGRVRLFLLDSNDPRNTPQDRGITSKLYGGGEEMRLQQEIALGIGGWRLLEALGLNCDVCHLNEGHAAFAAIERAKGFMKLTGCSFEVAVNCIRAGNIFTTHTPVDAAFDRYPASMFAPYARLYSKQVGLEEKEFYALGRVNPHDDNEPFNMAYLAMKCSLFINGVSRLHGKVSRHIFKSLFPRWPLREIPIGHVTNAVHVPSWESKNSDVLWSGVCGRDRWLGTLETIKERIEGISDEELWELRAKGRMELIEFVRKRLKWQAAASGLEAPADAYDEILDPNALTLGFARRFTEYKRPTLLLTDPDRLAHILNVAGKPVQLLIAGKAHPNDFIGKEMIRQWFTFLKRDDVFGKVIFIQDYDMMVAKKLVQGVDVWINNPRRPWEASGTSGMKLLVNGGLNLSELDGWWAEAYSPDVGWAIGDGKEHDHDPEWDRIEANELYEHLENDIIPTFYQRDEMGIPRKWVAMMKASMSRLTPQFSTNRMLRQYVEEYYIPAARAFSKRARNNGELGQKLHEWQRSIDRHWKGIYFGNLECDRSERSYIVKLQVYLDGLDTEMIEVQCYADPINEDGEPEIWKMVPKEPLKGAINGYLYQTEIVTDRPFSHYTPRIIPRHPEARIPLENSRILWFK
ncbi:MAG: glycosyltransferase family 1 protein [Thermodesulfobacteria bacterium]|nr:glycosyltransferase family 1 protein [Thermodesulfobacteriota bacterium]